MLTVKYNDPDGTEFVVEAEFVSYAQDGVRVHRKNDTTQHVAAYGDVYVMNASGATVAKYWLAPPEPELNTGLAIPDPAYARPLKVSDCKPRGRL